MVDGGAVLGPFVVPGVTACLRCVDAHQSLLDPDHVAVTSRYLRATAVPRDDGVPDVADVALLALALTWAARDVVAHLAGREPATFSRTIRFGRRSGASRGATVAAASGLRMLLARTQPLVRHDRDMTRPRLVEPA